MIFCLLIVHLTSFPIQKKNTNPSNNVNSLWFSELHPDLTLENCDTNFVFVIRVFLLKFVKV